MYAVVCIAVFALAFLAASLTITIGYHRGLAHRALTLHPLTRFIVVKGGIWLTCVDPKTWIVMHRMHHTHSDTEDDPHAPSDGGLPAMIVQQSVGATKTFRGLRRKHHQYMKFASDLDFEINPVVVRVGWWLPYVVHAIAGIALGWTVGWVCGAAYFVGITSHPITGAMVNYYGHHSGRRNFETPDVSRNNLLVGWLFLGEGFQNNHHRYPRSASFAYRRHELDVGYIVCRALDAVGLITINRERLIRKPQRPS